MLACVRKLTPDMDTWRNDERKLSPNNTTASNVFKAYTKLGSRIFDKFNYEITKDTKSDFRCMQTDHACISKLAIKEKTYLGNLKTGKIKKKYLETDKWYTKAKWPTQRRQKIHSHKPDTSTQSSHLQELVPSNLTKIPFGHVILEDRQSFATDLMWALHTQTDENTVEIWVRYCMLCCSFVHRAICFQKCLHLIGGFCARSSSREIQSGRDKTCWRHISSNIVLKHRRRCAQHRNQPVYAVASVEQLTALLAILWVLLF